MANDNGKATSNTPKFHSLDPALWLPVDSYIYKKQTEMLRSDNDSKTREFANSKNFYVEIREKVAQEIIDDPNRGDQIMDQVEKARIENIYTKAEKKYVEAYKQRRAAEQRASGLTP
jgi:hypothetical protein